MPMLIRWPLATGCVCAEPKHQQLQALREEAAAAPTRQKAAATPFNLLSGVRVVRMTAGTRATARTGRDAGRTIFFCGDPGSKG
jgi:hypothetical protein